MSLAISNSSTSLYNLSNCLSEESTLLEDYKLVQEYLSFVVDDYLEDPHPTMDPIQQDDIQLPARSPARLLNQKPIEIPDSPDLGLSDSSSIDYNSYGSDRSSRSSIFSDHQTELQPQPSPTDSPEGLSDEEMLVLYGYVDVEQEQVVNKVHDVITISYSHNGNDHQKSSQLKVVDVQVRAPGAFI
ncbi:hypothetical protein PSN45_002785 [Yamadazyma tenuis]|uniref:Uncharacterized protein n=1 Tax=Candida tenuis (strain ATCC 10573 / BCRC 21748 / CBS 615 / JCM 9827 / NBRC 10315 / NRRL Y-1498 / VKM Y-70) TaxID=590646 RepID=G3AWS1_CANTC|nr:uncharacterized protein CANTEDRAFT_112318 [Yamadazyma tenuis ATCC 10573]XP_006684100.1 uncharacterized protein CANTEDRAFT_112318 [Yamadazyma tenuis ATCC 10573]EGV66841.1 hypothetical protein CANTEDRAFT_112318 [Yamadazyma tenuis ATCC 10573]EGV66842.1 hypothetical protein CANTEDRAFT_112318 [Yamadazyma tenuis ATCC 10573]WEJ95272.1 hypothetical protein PSN45_002785 [Yamadazyma tenuis]